MSGGAVEEILSEKSLPSNIEAECSILGAIMLDNAVYHQAIKLLRREDFFLDSHRRIFDKMVRLTERCSPIDLITLTDELRRAREFEKIGGATYIAALIDGVPRTDNIEPYAKIVKQKAVLRAFIAVTNIAIQDAFDEEDEPEIIIGNHLNRVDEIRTSIESNSMRGRLLHANDLASEPPVEWLIDNEIPQGGLTVLYGPSGAGKSFVALDYALRVAQFAPVVYIAAEGASGYTSRTNAWTTFNKQTTGRLHFWLDAVQMLNARAVAAFLREVAKLQPAFVIVDTLARSMIGGDENSAKDMGLFVDGCARIQKTGAAVMALHHTPWNSARLRGSSALYGAADSIIELSNEDGLIQVRQEKLKDGKLFETRHLRLIEIADSCVPIPANKVAMEYAPLSERQRKLLEALNLAIFEESGARLKQIVSVSGLAESTVCYSLSKLKRQGYITQAKSGDPYYISNKGKSLFAPIELEQFGVEQSPENTNPYGDGSNHSKDAPISNNNGRPPTRLSTSNNSNPPLRGWSLGVESNGDDAVGSEKGEL